MDTKMEENSGESRSGEAMSIFAQSIDMRRPGRSRRRAATHKSLSPEIEQPARPSVERPHPRRGVAERAHVRAEFELSRARSMAKELERQIDHARAKASSHRSELQGTRATGSGRRKKVLVDGEAPGADQAQDQSTTLYAEVMQELDRVKRELRQLQREVKAAREAKASSERDAETPTPVLSSSSSRPLGGVKREAGKGNEARRTAELAEAGGFGNDVQARRARARGQQRAAIRAASESDERFATASSSDVGIEPAVEMEMAMVPATEETDRVENGESALTITRYGEQEHDDRSPLQAAEAELTSARVELESIREEGLRFTNSIERTRQETARVAEEIDRLAEQEKRASAQVQQLNARLHRAKSRLDAAMAADERAEATLAELSAALRQLGEETEAAEKERALTEQENRCVRDDAESVGAEIAAAERRVKEAVKQLEAARASEAAATARLRAVLDRAMWTRAAAATTPQRSGSGSVTVPRFEYEYLTGRAEVIWTVAEKKVAAAEAWVDALRAGEKEVEMRTEAIERELGETVARRPDEADGQRAAGQELRDGSPSQQRPRPRRRPAPRLETELSVVSQRTRRTPPSSVVLAQKATPPSFSMKKKRRVMVSKYLKLMTGRCRGRS